MYTPLEGVLRIETLVKEYQLRDISDRNFHARLEEVLKMIYKPIGTDT